MHHRLLTTISVLCAALLGINIAPAAQGDLPTPADPINEARKLLATLPQAIRDEWTNATGTPVEAALELAPMMLAALHDELSTPPETPQQYVDMTWRISRAAVVHILGYDPTAGMAVMVTTADCHAFREALGPAFNSALQNACRILAAAMIPLVALVIVAVILVVIVVAFALTDVEPILGPVIDQFIELAKCPDACSTDPSPPPPAAPPPLPPIPPQGRVEYIVNGTLPTDVHDHDGDGVSDMWDTVNLPSEATATTQVSDALQLLEGLPAYGFALLVPPTQDEALLVVANPIEILAGSPAYLEGGSALDRIENIQGQEIRNALAGVLPEGTIVRYVPIAAETSLHVPLGASSSQAADGSWLLVTTDPTRDFGLTLAGASVTVASGSLSQFSLNETHYRWHFLNLHHSSSFCYDPTTAYPGSSCIGVRWPGWLRTYSGNAATTLQALQAGLEAGTVPVTTTPPTVRQIDPEALPVQVEEPEGLPSASMMPRLIEAPQIISVSPETEERWSPWQSISNGTKWATGIGVDYVIQGTTATSQVQQVSTHSLMGDVTQTPTRLFRFDGSFSSTHANPRNITHIQLRIEDLDGNHAGQTFLIDGKALHELLDIQPGDTLNVDIDEAHRDGFASLVRDANNDGIDDLLVYVPHFSVTWIDVTNSNTRVHFQRVILTSATTGWVSGASATVYRYANGLLDARPIPGLTGTRTTIGLHVVSDNEFYVGVGCDGDRSMIARYYYGSYSTKELPGCFGVPSAIWISGDGSHGRALAHGRLFKLAGGSWTEQTSPTDCSLNAFSLDWTGAGLVGAYDVPSCNGVGVYYYDGSTFSPRSDPDVLHVRDFASSGGTYGVGVGPIQVVGTKWQPSTGYPSAGYQAADQVPGADAYWFVGSRNADGTGGAHAVSRIAGLWAQASLPSSLSTLTDLDLYSSQKGLAVGLYGALVRFEDYTPPIVTETLSPLAGSTETVFTVDGTGTRYANGDPVSQSWSWGDGASSSTNIATHKYAAPGTYEIRHSTLQQGQWVVNKVWTVTVTSASLTVGSTFSAQFVPVAEDKTINAPYRTAHYKVPSSGQDRYLSITLAETGSLTPHTYLSATFATDGSAGVGGTGTPWPAADSVIGRGAGRFEIAGLVPAGKELDVQVKSWLYEDANVKDAYGARTSSWGNVGFTLLAVTAPTPLAPATSFAAGLKLPAVTLSATAPHNAVRQTQLLVEWGDGQQWLSDYRLAGTTHYPPTHTYAPGAYTIRLSSIDQAGQSAVTTRAITVHDVPQVTTTGATTTANQATLTGTVSSLGGAATTSAFYRLMLGATTVQTSPTYVLAAPGALPAWTALGLTSGAGYSYIIVATNDVATTQTPPASASTAGPLSIVASIQSNPSTALGAASSISLTASASHSRNIAYYVRWDTGASEFRYPASGFVPWNQAVSASRVLPFAGVHAVDIRIEDDLQARGSVTRTTTTVTGATPISGFQSTPGLASATIAATASGLGVSPVKMRFGVRDTAAYTWTYGAYFDAYAGNTYTHTPSLSDSRSYLARIEMYDPADNQAWTSGTIAVRTNQAPTLTVSSTPALVSHLGSLRYAVTYVDTEGDAPRNAAGVLQAPQVTVNGTTYTMHLESGSPMAGATYYYNVPSAVLPQGVALAATYTVHDQYQRQVSKQGPATYVAQEALVYYDFEAETVGQMPSGMMRSWQASNLWHVADSQSSSMPQRVTRGLHGKVLWFGNPDNGNYNTGGSAYGEIWLPAMDLRKVVDPALSFSSFYETEAVDDVTDHKIIQISTHTPWGWSGWTHLKVLTGNESGYGEWRSQHIDLRPYQNQVIRLRFTFSANAQNNNHLGWLVDDIVIGHDHDRDSLPDRLERLRNDVLVTAAPVTVEVPDAGTARGYVRRLDRPISDALALHAIIKAPDASKLRIAIGARDGHNGLETKTTIFDGSRTGGCAAASPDFVGPAAPSADGVEVRSDGIVLRIEAFSCGLQIPQLADWFIEVTDKKSGDKKTWLQSMYAVSKGKTHYAALDSDQDDVSDGVEVSGMKDALGFDSDQDSLTGTMDPDDTLPSWAPATKVSSADYAKTVTISFRDALSPLLFPKLMGHYAATGNERTYSVWQEGDSWRINTDQYLTQEGALPDSITIQWRDVYRNQGSVELGMQTLNGKYRPTGIGWTAIDAKTGRQVDAEGQLMEDLSMAASFFVVGLAVGPVPDGELAGAGTAIYSLGRYAVVRAAAGFAVAAVSAGGALMLQEFLADHEAVRNGYIFIQADTAHIAQLAQSLGLSVAAFKASLAEAQRLDTVGGVTRWLHEVQPGVLIVITTKGLLTHALQNAWKYQLPPEIDWNRVDRLVEDLVALEKMVHESIKSRHVSAEVRSILTAALPSSCLLPTDFLIESTSPGLPDGREVQYSIPMCVTIALGKAMETVEKVDAYMFRQDLVDSVIGETTFGHLKEQASKGRFQGPFYWYWDDGNQEADCQDASSWVHSDIRRCNGYNSERLLDQLEAGTMTYTRDVTMCYLCATTVPTSYRSTKVVPDVFSVRELEWESSGVKQFRDAFSSNGMILSFHNIATEGLDYRPWALQAMEAQLEDLPQEDLDAHVDVVYQYSELQMLTRVNFQAFEGQEFGA